MGDMELREENVLEAANEILKELSDGFQPKDIQVIVKNVVKFAKAFDIPGDEKKKLAMSVVAEVLAKTDFPGWPDVLVLPILGDVGADRFCLEIIDHGIDLLVDALKGRLGFNLNPPSGTVVMD